MVSFLHFMHGSVDGTECFNTSITCINFISTRNTCLPHSADWIKDMFDTCHECFSTGYVSSNISWVDRSMMLCSIFSTVIMHNRWSQTSIHNAITIENKVFIISSFLIFRIAGCTKNSANIECLWISRCITYLTLWNWSGIKWFLSLHSYFAFQVDWFKC